MITAEQRNRSKGKARTTTRHRIALKEILDSRGKSIGKALIRSGYSIPTAKNPEQIINAKGFQALLKKEGLTPSFVTKALKEDIENKPLKRVEELKLAADILRMRGNNQTADSFTPTQVNIILMEASSESPLSASRTHETEKDDRYTA